MSNKNIVNLAINNTKDKYVFRPYGVCNTVSSDPDKIVVFESKQDVSEFSLVPGATIIVKFNSGNFNLTDDKVLTLNVNSTGAKEIKHRNEFITSNKPIEKFEDKIDRFVDYNHYWEAGDVIEFIYDGASWVMMDKNYFAGEGIKLGSKNPDKSILTFNLKPANINEIGGLRVASVPTENDKKDNIKYCDLTTESERFYLIQRDANDLGYVNVPWKDTPEYKSGRGIYITTDNIIKSVIKAGTGLLSDEASKNYGKNVDIKFSIDEGYTATVSFVNGKISEVNNKVNNLDKKVDNINTDLTGKINNINSTINTMQSEINSIKQDITGIRSDIQSLLNVINNLDSDFVKKSGDTMTGSLTAPAFYEN